MCSISDASFSALDIISALEVGLCRKIDASTVRMHEKKTNSCDLAAYGWSQIYNFSTDKGVFSAPILLGVV